MFFRNVFASHDRPFARPAWQLQSGSLASGYPLFIQPLRTHPMIGFLPSYLGGTSVVSVMDRPSCKSDMHIIEGSICKRGRRRPTWDFPYRTNSRPEK